MSAIGRRRAVWLAYTFGTIGVAIVLMDVVLRLITSGEDLPEQAVSTPAELLDNLTLLALPLIGGLVASRRPDNPLGWLFLAAGLGVGFSNLGSVYAAHGIVKDPGALPASYFVAWLSSWTWIFGIGSLPMLTLLFPTGRLFSPRWRPAFWMAIAAMALFAVSALVLSLSLRHDPFVPDDRWPPDAVLLRNFFIAGLAGVILASLFGSVSLVFRFIAARGEERQQLKWVSSGVFALVLAQSLSLVAEGAIVDWSILLGQLLLYASLAIAILRYRLYDIDRIINRTLVYGLLTAGLGGTYALLVVGLQAVLRPLSGGSDLAVVVTTLTVAALFLPARRRVQDTVDRRFNRRHYDAVHTVDAFSAPAPADRARHPAPRAARRRRPDHGAEERYRLAAKGARDVSPRRLLRLEALMALLALVFAGGIAALAAIDLIDRDVNLETGSEEVLGDTLIGLLFLGVGLFLALRKPGHLVGLALLATALGVTSYRFFGMYTNLTLDPDSGAPGTALAATCYSFPWPCILGGLFLLVLSFPGGSLPGAYWRRFVPVWTVAAALVMAAYWVIPGMLEPPYKDIRGPLVIDALEPLKSVTLVPTAVILLGTAVACLDLVRRFLRSRGVEREQFRWLAFAGVLGVLSFVGSAFSPAFEDVQGLSFCLFPIAIGIAVLRYRLYDIDRIINRTLVYAFLTAILVALYAGLVIGLQEVLRPLNGGSDLAVVVTTLTVAALFLPARQRVQSAVDRRFNRRQYDAARTVDAFSARLRQQIELDTLRYELLAVVDETMAPVTASLWVRNRSAVE